MYVIYVNKSGTLSLWQKQEIAIIQPNIVRVISKKLYLMLSKKTKRFAKNANE